MMRARKRGIVQRMGDDVSTLCRACALCCDGTLFAYVSVSPAEAEALRARDLALSVRKDGSYRLQQRCGALASRSCAAYAERPSACRAYACLLATELEQGERPLAEALSLVNGAHAQLAELRAALGAPEDASPVPALRAALAGEGPAPSSEAHARWQSVREYLRRHFTGRHGLS